MAENQTCGVKEAPPIRLSDTPFITVIGNTTDLNDLIEYLSIPFSSTTFTLPAFELKPELGDKVLIINLNTYEMYKTEDGIKLGEYKRFYIPQDLPALAKELYFESQRIKQREYEQQS